MKIFVVDDDRIARMVVSHQLSKLDHEVMQLDSGEAMLSAVGESPDLILLDISMPGMGGLDACRLLHEADNPPPVIFISANDSIEARLLAYEVGGRDYIVKPYPPQELERKIRLAEDAREKVKSLENQVQFAQSTAFAVMSSLGEMGVALQCLKGSFSARSVNTLATGIFEALCQYDLRGLLEFRAGTGVTHHFSPQGGCSPLESSVISHAAKMGRIFQFRDRLVINYPTVTLLVLGLPVHDAEKVGRLRDALAILIEGSDARLRAMDEENQRLAQAYEVQAALKQLTQALADIENSQTDVRWKTLEANDHYLEELTRYLGRLGYEGGQESLLIEMAGRHHSRLSTIVDESYSAGHQLREVISKLDAIGAETSQCPAHGEPNCAASLTKPSGSADWSHELH
jgi:CheY-like chemotaxis protein